MRGTSCFSVLLLFAFALGVGLPAKSLAYCRTTTEETEASGCPEQCQTEGAPLYWPTRELSYVLNRRGVPNLPMSTLREILIASFGQWQEARCADGRPVGLLIEQEPGTTDLEVGPQLEEPNRNVIVHIPADEWEDDPRAFAITKLWFRPTIGHIVGVDISLNGGMDPFGVCPDERGCSDDWTTDLRNVITHEAGHFLGLAHSEDPDSTMWCDAAPGDVDKRDLGDDDAAGLCAIYGPNAQPDPDAASAQLSRRRKSSCSASPSGSGPGARGAALLLAALAVIAGRLAVRRRRCGTAGTERGGLSR